MKIIIIGAIALLVAAPVAAQAVPVADPHAGHAQHQQQGKGHDQHGQDGKGHEGHAMDCCKGGKHGDCCKTMAQQGAKMACCEKGEHNAGAHADHGGH